MSIVMTVKCVTVKIIQLPSPKVNTHLHTLFYMADLTMTIFSKKYAIISIYEITSLFSLAKQVWEIGQACCSGDILLATYTGAQSQGGDFPVQGSMQI